MFSLISSLKNKPKRIRKLAAVSLAGGFTFLIFIFWMSGHYLNEISITENRLTESERHGPFKVINRYVENLLGGAGSFISETGEAINRSGIYELYDEYEKELERSEYSDPYLEEEDLGDKGTEDTEEFDQYLESGEKEEEDHLYEGGELNEDSNYREI